MGRAVSAAVCWKGRRRTKHRDGCSRILEGDSSLMTTVVVVPWSCPSHLRMMKPLAPTNVMAGMYDRGVSLRLSKSRTRVLMYLHLILQ